MSNSPVRKSFNLDPWWNDDPQTQTGYLCNCELMHVFRCVGVCEKPLLGRTLDLIWMQGKWEAEMRLCRFSPHNFTHDSSCVSIFKTYTQRRHTCIERHENTNVKKKPHKNRCANTYEQAPKYADTSRHEYINTNKATGPKQSKGEIREQISETEGGWEDKRVKERVRNSLFFLRAARLPAQINTLSLRLLPSLSFLSLRFIIFLYFGLCFSLLSHLSASHN